MKTTHCHIDYNSRRNTNATSKGCRIFAILLLTLLIGFLWNAFFWGIIMPYQIAVHKYTKDTLIIQTVIKGGRHYMGFIVEGILQSTGQRIKVGRVPREKAKSGEIISVFFRNDYNKASVCRIYSNKCELRPNFINGRSVWCITTEDMSRCKRYALFVWVVYIPLLACFLWLAVNKKMFS